MQNWQSPRGLTAWPKAFAALLVALSCHAPVVAQSKAGRGVSVSVQAINEPLGAFLERILALDGIATRFSALVSAVPVNGKFKGNPLKIFRDLSDSNGLMWYSDGATLYVYSLSEVETRLLESDISDVPRVEQALRDLRLYDARFPIRLASTEGQLIVAGPPRYVDVVSQLVQRISRTPSKPVLATGVRVFKLKYARAADTKVSIGGVETAIAGVASVLAQITASSAKEAASTPARVLPRTVAGLRGSGQKAVGRADADAAANLGDSERSRQGNSDTAGFPPLPPSTGRLARGPLPPPQQGEPTVTTPLNENASQVPSGFVAMVRAEPRLNAVIVSDLVERMPIYERLIAELDVESALIEIEATVIDIAGDQSSQIGIDWRLHSSKIDLTSSPGGLAGIGTAARNAANGLLFSASPTSAGIGGIGTLILGSERTYLLARLNLLAERGDAKLVSRPRVLTMDNTEAVLQNTQEFYVRVAGRDQVDLFNVSSGLTLRVTPSMTEDQQGRRFKLLVRIEDGNATGGTQVDQIPVVSRNSIATQAMVPEGQSLLIGGYVIEERKATTSGLPGLSEGTGFMARLFGQRSTSDRRIERVIMITPRLVGSGSMELPATPLSLAPSRAMALPSANKIN